jgi:exonuclease SbcC
MQILSIHLKDIKSHRDTDLTFSAGINVLSGANGAGKSTVFEAIGYALFGVDARDFVSNVDRFISIGAKNGKISVIFQCDNNEIWQVTRTVGTSSKWLLSKKSGDSFEVEEHAGIGETEARISELLGLANGRPLSEQFKLVIGPFQNDFLGPFIIRQTTKRQEAFDEILGIDTWRKTFKGTGSLLSLVQEKMKILEAEVQGLDRQVVALPQKEAEFNITGGVLKEKQTVLTERDFLLRKLETLLTDFDNREKNVTALNSEIQLLEGRIKDGGEKIATQKLRVDEALRALSVVNASRSGKESYDKAELQLAELRNLMLKRRSIEQDITALELNARLLLQTLEHEEKSIAQAEKEFSTEDSLIGKTRQELQVSEITRNSFAVLQALRSEADRLKAERSLLEGRRAGLVEGKDDLAEGICPFFQEQCRNVAGLTPGDIISVKIDTLDRAMAELDRLIGDSVQKVSAAEKAEKEFHANSIRLQELDKRAADLEAARRKNCERLKRLEISRSEQVLAVSKVAVRQSELNAFATLDSDIEMAEGVRKRFQAVRDAYTAQRKDADDLENRRQTLAQWERGLEILQSDLNARQTAIMLLREQYDEERHQELRVEKERLLTDVATCRQQVDEIGRTLLRLDKEIAALRLLQALMTEKQVLIKSFEKKERLVKFLRNQVFRNVSAQLSERFREEISLRADRIYRSIAESDEELLWGENYQIILRDMAEGVIRERSDDQLSGGQTMSAVVALRLALLQTIGARVAFFDEPTSNLDASRRENLAQAFRAIDVGREEVVEHWYDQLFLVSHDVAFTEITDQMIQIGE